MLAGVFLIGRDREEGKDEFARVVGWVYSTVVVHIAVASTSFVCSCFLFPASERKKETKNINHQSNRTDPAERRKKRKR